MRLALTAVNGKLLCVENAGADNVGLINARTLPSRLGPWETLEERPVGAFVMLSCDASGRRRYFSAQPDGTVVCNRVEGQASDLTIPADLKSAVGPWELWQKIHHDGGGVSYLSAHGTYLCCDLGQPIEVEPLWSGHRVVCDRTAIGPYEVFRPIVLAGDADPRHLQSAFCIPEAMPDGSRVWTPGGGCDPAKLTQMCNALTARRYNTFEYLIDGKPYRDDYPELTLAAPADVDRVVRDLSYIKSRGLTTIAAIDERHGIDIMSHRGLCDAAKETQGLVDWMMGIYEVNGVLQDPEKVLSVLVQLRQLWPSARLAVHFTPLDEGEESYGLVDLHRAVNEADLNCVFLQYQAWVDLPTTIARAQDWTRRVVNRMHGWPQLSDGACVFELSTSKTYRGEWTEAQGIAATDAVMGAPLVEDGGVPAAPFMGFMDGGTVR